MTFTESESIIEALHSQINSLPVGYISKKTIHGNTCYYRQWKENGKVKSQYVPNNQVDYIVSLINRRKSLQSELRIETYRSRAESDPKARARLIEYGRKLHLEFQVPIGVQDYETLSSKNLFYIDKTFFISDWWNHDDVVTLITRPRRFGKTLNLSMVNCFFSKKYANRSDLFDKFEVWNDRNMRSLQGTIPTIFISFGGIKESDARGQLMSLKSQIHYAYYEHKYIIDMLPEQDKKAYCKYLDPFGYTDEMIISGINELCRFIHAAYGQNSIILIDEYDTPMLEAWVGNSWSTCANNMRLFFNKTLKTNPYIKKALLTGITRISKESFFSDLNHLKVCSMTSHMYDYAFGFTEDEVFNAMKYQQLDNFDEVKSWYDGFTVGNRTDIYNPWSIINFLADRKIKPYWVNSSSNAMINSLFKEGDTQVKQSLESLIDKRTIRTTMKEETPFEQVATSAPALWSLLFASGYLKIVNITPDNIYELGVTNKEVHLMLIDFVKEWFDANNKSRYGGFLNAMLCNDVGFMQEYLERIIRATFSYFDVSGDEPERFYHGFILGTIINLRDRFIISSNRESGLGRYDLVLIPRNPEKYHAIILEFKVHHPRKEANLVDTALNALKQIDEKNYAAIILEQGISENNIYKYGIAFRGKEIWIEGGQEL